MTDFFYLLDKSSTNYPQTTPQTPQTTYHALYPKHEETPNRSVVGDILKRIL